MKQISPYEADNIIAEQQNTQGEYPDTKLGNWLKGATLLKDIATALSTTAMVPAELKKDPTNTHREVLAVILAGDEAGLTPIQSLQNINFIQGKPAMTAIAMRGLVTSSGHEVWVEEADEQHCVMGGRRKGTEREQHATWDMTRATKAGLTNKENWKKQPQAMLTARATSEICRLIAADALMGISYTAEELAGT